MKINPKYKIRKVADENVVLIQGRNPGDMTTVIALNVSSFYLWNELQNAEFTRDNIVNLLTSRFDVDEDTAGRDADKWIAELQKYNIIS